MSIDARRVFLMSLALIVGVAVVAKKVFPHDAPPVIDDPGVASPVLDAADPDVRRAIFWVAQEGDEGAAASPLFRKCEVGAPDQYRVATTPGLSRDMRERELLITRQGAGALLQYSDREFLAPPEQEDPRFESVAIGANERRAFDALFAKAGYPQTMRPWDGTPCMDAGQRRIESCLGGRYYAVHRACMTPGDRLAFDVLELAEKQFAAAGKPLPIRE